MKKVILCFMLLAFGFTFAQRVNAVTELIPYHIEFYEGGYNALDTGLWVNNPDYSTTTRIRIMGNYVLPDELHAHYLLLWNSYGAYQGYYTIDGYIDSYSTWLGDYSNGAFTLFYDTTFFTLVANTAGVQSHTNLAKPGGGYWTYEDILGNPDFDLDMPVEGYTLNEVMANPDGIEYKPFDDFELGEIFTAPTYLNYVIQDEDINPTAVTLAESFDYADTVVTNIGFSRANLNAYSAEFTSEGITVLSLTNLIQNGQFANTNNWTNSGLATFTVSNGEATFLANSQSDYAFQKYATVSGSNYYVRMDYKTTSALVYIYITSYGVPSNAIVTNGSSVWTTFSNVYTANQTNSNAEFSLLDFRTTGFSNFYMRNVSAFKGDYSKTQIDTALSYFGYLTYNTAYDLPDTTDSDFVESGYGITGTAIGVNSYLWDYQKMYQDDLILTPNNSAFANWRNEWSFCPVGSCGYVETITGINPQLLGENGLVVAEMSSAERTYYTGLYHSALLETERYEWYDWAGVTDENYDYLLGLYDDALINEMYHWEFFAYGGVTAETMDYYADLQIDSILEVYRYEFFDEYGVTSNEQLTALKTVFDELDAQTAIDYPTFETNTAFFSAEVVEELTFKEWIIDWLTNTANLTELSINLISLGIMLIILIVMLLLKAKWYLYLLVEFPLFAFFTIMGFFDTWVAVGVVAVALIIVGFIIETKE